MISQMDTTPLTGIEECSAVHDCILTYGHFNTIHAGHIRYLKHARSRGKKVVTALMGDISKKFQAPFQQKDRAEGLQLVGLSDQIVLLKDEEIAEAVIRIQPKELFLGPEYSELVNDNELSAALSRTKCSLIFHAGDVEYASTDLLNDSEKTLKLQRLVEFRNACSRQKLTLSELRKSIQAWERAKLIVIGDTIVDQFAACEALGLSAEAPVVVVKELEQRDFLGAAAIVAAHIRALGAQCDFISVVGEDSHADFVERQLSDQGIYCGLIRDKTRPTTFKKRYVVENQKLFRVSRLEQHDVNSDVEEALLSEVEARAEGSHGIVISDFVYGVITPRILEGIRKIARNKGLLLFGDLQCSSQVGSILKFEDFSLLCPNERELRISLQDKDGGLESLSQRLIDLTNCQSLIVKMASKGFLAYERIAGNEIVSQQFPALSVNPVDQAGAGDSVLAVMATGLAINEGLMPTSALACCIAAIAVETMGNTPVDRDAIEEKLLECFPD